jgi:hypothetical protein
MRLTRIRFANVLDVGTISLCIVMMSMVVVAYVPFSLAMVVQDLSNNLKAKETKKDETNYTA